MKTSVKNMYRMEQKINSKGTWLAQLYIATYNEDIKEPWQ
ncbi:hypothetical protein C1A50_2240 [Paenibacillus polymyxa]|nr:hypothetical protein C1A50_2240 [Paenibacillus polymyxa]